MAAEELPGHLALSLRLENVAVLLGSGASVPAGGNTMATLWSQLIEADPSLQDWLVSEGFLKKDETPNIEELLGELEIAIHDAKRRKEDLGELAACADTIRRAVISAAMLAPELWEDRSSVPAQEKLGLYTQLLARLQGSRQPGQSAPWVFTTNYDLSIEWAAEALGIHVVNGFAGLHDRRFQPNAFDLSLQNTRASGEARFGSYNLNLVKLHGSLNWALSDAGEPVELPCDSAHQALQAFIRGEKDASLSSFLIQPAAAKYVDTVGFTFGELIRRFTEYLSRPNTTLIICGYGFNDAHVNRLIASGLLNPTLQLVIYYSGWKTGTTKPDNKFLAQLMSLRLPRVIVRGGGEAAHFDKLVRDLPDPALTDELPSDARRLLAQLARTVAPPDDPGAGGGKEEH